MKPLIFIIFLILTLVSAKPEQITVGYLNSTTYSFTWANLQPSYHTAYVSLNGNQYPAQTESFLNFGSEFRLIYISRAIIPDMIAGEIHQYKVGNDADGWSDLLTLRTVPDQGPWVIGVYGDLGFANPQAFPAINIWSNYLDMIWHIGDLGYNLDDDNGRVGDNFMNMIMPVSSLIPYQVSPGNHEEDMDTFHQFKNRFTMPNWETHENMYYTFDVGPLHVISMNTEAYMDGVEILFVEQFYNWFVDHLETFNRTRTNEWLIVYGHRPFYCTDSDDNGRNPNSDCSVEAEVLKRGFQVGNRRVFGLEELFNEYKVDLVLSAHEHNYERMLPCYHDAPLINNHHEPYTDAPAPVYIVSGAAGCPEQLEGFLDYPNTPCSVLRIHDYGFGVIQVSNASTLLWQQISKDGTQVVDEIVLRRTYYE